MLFGYFNFFLKTNLIIINCPFFNQSYFNYSCMQYLYLYISILGPQRGSFLLPKFKSDYNQGEGLI